MTTKLTVLGAGSWGTALALLLSRSDGANVRLWTRTTQHADEMRAAGENTKYLPGFAFPGTLQVSDKLEEAVHQSEAIVLAVPTHGMREALGELDAILTAPLPLINTSKGIENESLKFMSDLVAERFPDWGREHYVCLSGPSFAKEVAQGLPTAVAVASQNESVAKRVQDLFATERFRAYTTDDVVGVEVGGALKNVIAIAVGVCDGLGMGHNGRAALITRGLAEITRLATKLGANPLTLSGLSGLGDLVLTCTGGLSRNRSLGIALGQGKQLDEVLQSMTMVVEGVRTAKSAYFLAEQQGVDMPIVKEAFDMLHQGKQLQDAVASLLSRSPKPERDYHLFSARGIKL